MTGRKKKTEGAGRTILIAALVLAVGGGAAFLFLQPGSEPARTAAAAPAADPLQAGLETDRREFAAEMKLLGFTGETDVAALAADVQGARGRSSKAQLLIGRYRSKVTERSRQARREVVRQYPGEAAREAAVAAFDARWSEPLKNARARWDLEASVAQERGLLIQTLAYTEWDMAGGEVKMASPYDGKRLREDLARLRKAEAALADFDQAASRAAGGA